MTEVNETQIEQIEEEVIEEVIPEPEYEKFLKAGQVEALKKAGLVSKKSIRAASDEELVKLNGVGLSTASKLKEWATGEVKEGEAISNSTVVFADKNGDPIEVKPGDVVPAEHAERMVEKGRARWQK